MKLDPARKKKGIEYVLSVLQAVDPSGINAKIFQERSKTLTDEELIRICDGIPIYQPVGGKTKVSYVNNIKVAEKMGIKIEQRVWLTEPKTGVQHLTRYPHLILMLPIRRQTQMQEAKMSLAKNDRVRDKLTGQVTGPSKASGISFPEAYNIYGDRLDNSLSEFLHARGGNEALQRAFYQSIRQTGRGRINIPGAERTSAKSTRTWASMWKAMHIGTNIGRPQ